MNHGKIVTLYEWPKSQICMNCDHGNPVQFIKKDDYVASSICFQACSENDGTDCPKMNKEEDNRMECIDRSGQPRSNQELEEALAQIESSIYGCDKSSTD